MITGYELWRGTSLIDHTTPIVAIMTMRSKNRKTGDMVQIWILLQHTNPMEAVRTDQDHPICGDCVHRIKRSCYVEVWQAPNNIWKQWTKDKYPKAPSSLTSILCGRAVRIGAYGDPAAVPVEVWDRVTNAAASITGYTHGWQGRPDLARYCMASVETRSEREAAKALGFRTYRAHTATEKHIPTEEAQCPAAKEAGEKVTCAQCGYCNGTSTGFRGDVAIELHGRRSNRVWS